MTARFVEGFSDELERQLHDACGHADSEEISIPSTKKLKLVEENKSGDLVLLLSDEPEHRSQLREEDIADNERPQTLNTTVEVEQTAPAKKFQDYVEGSDDIFLLSILARIQKIRS